MPHTEHFFLVPFLLVLSSRCLKQNMKRAALFIIPQLNFVLFSVSILVGDQTDELLGCWELGDSVRGIQSSPVNELELTIMLLLLFLTILLRKPVLAQLWIAEPLVRWWSPE